GRRRELRRGQQPGARRDVAALFERARGHHQEFRAHPRDESEEARHPADDLCRCQGLRQDRDERSPERRRSGEPRTREAGHGHCSQGERRCEDSSQSQHDGTANHLVQGRFGVERAELNQRLEEGQTMAKADKIIYTKTDESPMLATYSFLPIINAFSKAAGVTVELRDISLAGRVIAVFPEYLTPEQKQHDALAELGELAKTPEANIIKLPNISASAPQLVATIKELQKQGYKLPDYPETPKDDKEREIKARYDKVKGSAVNPVLREGNSDRRAPLSVKNFARKHPHAMGVWSPDSKSHVAHMSNGDFYGSEKSALIASAGSVKIEHVAADGSVTVLKEKVNVLAGEIIDSSVMSKQALRDFIAAQIEDAKAK